MLSDCSQEGTFLEDSWRSEPGGMEGVGDGLGEEGCLGEVNGMGKSGGGNMEVPTGEWRGPLTKRRVKYFWAFLTSWPDAVTPTIYLIY